MIFSTKFEVDLTNRYLVITGASPVLTATGFVIGNGQFSKAYRIDTPQSITKNFVTGHYVGDPYGCAKLGAHLSTRHMGEI